MCAPARTNVVGQATSRSLFGAVQLAGVACVAQKKWRSIYHGTCAAHFHSSFGVVVEWAMGMWWRGVVVGGWMHLNIAHVLSSMLVHIYSSLSFLSSCISLQVFSPMYVSHLWLLIVGRHLFFLGHGVS